MIDGVLVIDKPGGMTSHDVVAMARRALGERQIGHTGTLDPMATGVLALACGRATRLVRFLSASDKDYDAEIRLGLSTDTYDVTGREIERSERRPPRDAVVAALEALTGAYLQAPPPYSAKKITGRRAYDLARADLAVHPTPVPVCVSRLELTRFDEDIVAVRLTCSAGFYVRSLAHDLGARLGTGACLAALRRTRNGQFGLADATSPAELVRVPLGAGRSLFPLEQLLPGIPSVRVTEEGSKRVSHGRSIGSEHFSGALSAPGAWVRLLGPDGALVALAEPGSHPGSLHPSVVLI